MAKPRWIIFTHTNRAKRVLQAIAIGLGVAAGSAVGDEVTARELVIVGLGIATGLTVALASAPDPKVALDEWRRREAARAYGERRRTGSRAYGTPYPLFRRWEDRLAEYPSLVGIVNTWLVTLIGAVVAAWIVAKVVS